MSIKFYTFAMSQTREATGCFSKHSEIRDEIVLQEFDFPIRENIREFYERIF